MDEADDIERSRAASAKIREQHQRAQVTTNLIIVLLVVVVLMLMFTSDWRGSGRSVSDVQYKVAAKELIKQRLRDPSSAEFSALQVNRVPGRSTVVCGLVSSRNGFGGMSGPQRFISGDRVLLEEGLPAGRMDDEWARSC